MAVELGDSDTAKDAEPPCRGSAGLMPDAAYADGGDGGSSETPGRCGAAPAGHAPGLALLLLPVHHVCCRTSVLLVLLCGAHQPRPPPPLHKHTRPLFAGSGRQVNRLSKYGVGAGGGTQVPGGPPATYLLGLAAVADEDIYAVAGCSNAGAPHGKGCLGTDGRTAQPPHAYIRVGGRDGFR
jgi:hypothetical protein